MRFLLAVALTALGAALPALAQADEARLGPAFALLASAAPEAGSRLPVESADEARAAGSLPEALADYALQLLGVPYKRGGTNPGFGLDCSGLVRYVFEQVADITLPRTALAMSRVGERVRRRQLNVGDLVFFHTLRSRFSHVGIYLGDDRFIHAPHRGADVQVSDLSDPYWRRHFSGARRLVEGGRPLVR